MSLWHIIVILILIALNGFFVGVEFSVVSSRRSRLDILARGDSAAVRLVRHWLEDEKARDRLIAASQLGITVVSLALGSAGEKAFAALLEPLVEGAHLPPVLAFLDTILPALPLAISLTVVTAMHVVLGEQVPKVAVLRAPERFALFAAPWMRVFSTAFNGFISLLDWATRMVLRIAGLPEASHSHAEVGSLEELKHIVSSPDMDKVIAQPEQEMLSAVIDFSELVVRQVMIPRTEIVAIEADSSLREAIQVAASTPVTKIPIYDDNLDQILGILHLHDLIPALQDPGGSDKKVRELARETLFVPETISVNDLLYQFRNRKQHLAIVLDEYGGTAGLVTLEDLLEEIVGVVQDPFDAAQPAIQPQPDGSSLVDGMTLIEEINQYFGLELSDPHYDTIAGYMLGRLGHIPEKGEVVEDHEHGIRLRVENMDHLRIARIQLAHLDKA
ncbi:MAG TPA: hemolysin family protein [Anaerolineaceae bacterium]